MRVSRRDALRVVEDIEFEGDKALARCRIYTS
jgi:hypothetical protein